MEFQYHTDLMVLLDNVKILVKFLREKKMAGRLGNVQVTIQNLKILKVDHDNNLFL